MSEKVKQIVAQYLKISADAVTNETAISRERLGNSILVHRMYAALSADGFTVDNYSEIQYFGELLSKLGEPPVLSKDKNLPAMFSQQIATSANSGGGVGIDIEDVSSFPQVSDFREDVFYKMNFSQNEISYCVLRPNPLVSFAGLFAVKESLVKADNSLKAVSFNAIEITHDENGKPLFPEYEISISHTDTVAVAVVVKNTNTIPANAITNVSQAELSRSPIRVNWVSILALLLSLLALLKSFM